MFKPSNPYMVFPADLMQLDGDLGYPQIEFTVQGDFRSGNSFVSIYLPMPGSVGFTDGGNYETIDLGSIAAGGGIEALASILNGGISEQARDNAIANVKNAASQQINSIAPRVKSLLASQLPGIDKDMADFAQKKIRPPNQNTSFKGNTLRRFSFKFSLIANSSQDTYMISEIHRTFRRYTYAGSSNDAPNVILDYPPLWKIRFLQGNRENEYMPKIFACYLESMNCTFNEAANVIRYDGSPFDVSFGLQFQETRVLTRQDIDDLEDNKSDRGVDPLTGLAKSTIPAGISIPIVKPASTVTKPAVRVNPHMPTGMTGPFPHPS